MSPNQKKGSNPATRQDVHHTATSMHNLQLDNYFFHNTVLMMSLADQSLERFDQHIALPRSEVLLFTHCAVSPLSTAQHSNLVLSGWMQLTHWRPAHQMCCVSSGTNTPTLFNQPHFSGRLRNIPIHLQLSGCPAPTCHVMSLTVTYTCFQRQHLLSPAMPAASRRPVPITVVTSTALGPILLQVTLGKVIRTSDLFLVTLRTPRL